MKRLLSLFVAFALILACAPVISLQANATTSGDYTYTVSNGEATITDCNTSISGAITIPSTLGGYPVTSIGYSAFAYCESLTSIEIPNSVTSIDDWAFEYCSSLANVTIPDSVTYIGYAAFSGCRRLESISIPFVGRSQSGYYKYPFGQIFGCDSYYGGVKTLQRYYYGDNTDIANTVYYIPSSLKSVTVTGGVLYYGAFYDCSNITNIFIGDDVTSIGSYAFHGCSSLRYKGYDNGKYLGNSQNPYVALVDTVSTSITSCQIHPSTKIIAPSAFAGCSSLTSIEIPDGVTTIGDQAFVDCDSLTSIEIPDGVTTIGSHAFRDCNSLTGIWVDENNADYSNDSYGVLFNKNKTELVQAPGGIAGAYIIPAGVNSISSFAFYNCDGLISIEIPDSVTSIGSSAFSSCNSLNYNIYDNGKYLGNSQNPYVALVDTVSTSITSCQIHPSTKIIAPSAFAGCSSLISINIPDGVTTIGDQAFSFCDSLTSIEIPDSVTSIGSYVFDNCDSLTSVDIPDSVTSIGDDAFFHCDSLTSVTIGNGVTSIGDGAFFHCDSLTSVTIGNGVTSIGEGAFFYCDSLTDVYYAGTQSQWGKITGGSSIRATIHYNHIHDYSLFPPVEMAATCTEAGYTQYTCVYGETYKEYHTPALGHNYSGTVTVISPTCTEQGYTQTQCIRCEDIQKTDYTEILGHNYSVVVEVVSSTCTEQGYTITKCTRCEAAQNTNYTKALGHNYIIGETIKEPTCTAEGSAAVQCTRCNTLGTSSVAALGHSMALLPAKETTCTTEGLTAGTKCQRCDLVGIVQTVIPATGHSVENGVCTICGFAEAGVVHKQDNTEVYYDTLEEALSIATGGTIKLFADATVDTVILKPGVILDLNGYTLTADTVIVMNGATILDGGADCVGGGKLNIAKEKLLFVRENGQSIIPVWNGVDGYVFTKVTFQQLARTAGTGAAQYIFLPRFSNAEAAALMADGGAENGVQIKVGLTWAGGQCQQFYTYEDAFVEQVFASNGGLAFSLTVTGISGITDMTASAIIVTDSYAQASATGTTLVAG